MLPPSSNPYSTSSGLEVAPSGFVGSNPYITSSSNTNGNANNGLVNGSSNGQGEEGGEVVPSVPEITAVQGIVPTLQ